jgi:hypothetical protein
MEEALPMAVRMEDTLREVFLEWWVSLFVSDGLGERSDGLESGIAKDCGDAQ